MKNPHRGHLLTKDEANKALNLGKRYPITDTERLNFLSKHCTHRNQYGDDDPAGYWWLHLAWTHDTLRQGIDAAIREKG